MSLSLSGACESEDFSDLLFVHGFLLFLIYFPMFPLRTLWP